MNEPITKPTLVIDQVKLEKNIQRLKEKCQKTNITFRPHFKTHQSIGIGKLFRKAGINKITVSSVSMANYFVQDDWYDITIAIPVNLREIDDIIELAKNITLGIVIESQTSLELLNDKIPSSVSLNIWLEIDTGSGRTGFFHDDTTKIEKIAQQIQAVPNYSLQGILTHAGHTYLTRSPEEINQIYHNSVKRMNIVRDILHHGGLKDLRISVGDTPSCSVVKKLGDIDEARPGNFVFYDLKQEQLRSCTLDDIAIAVACPIISKKPKRKEIVIYGGTVHLSKESLQFNGISIYGKVVLPNKKNKMSWNIGLENVFVTSTSQEHGIVLCEDTEVFEALNIGDIVYILPVHSCITANLYENYYSEKHTWKSFRSL